MRTSASQFAAGYLGVVDRFEPPDCRQCGLADKMRHQTAMKRRRIAAMPTIPLYSERRQVSMNQAVRAIGTATVTARKRRILNQSAASSMR
jgi:hypothetical protein